jgi:hypothetical protein
MKKVILIIALMVSLVGVSQEKYESYTMSYFSSATYNLDVVTKSKDVYVSTSTFDKYSKNTGFTIKYENLQELNIFLTYCRDKFNEWSGVAKENNITTLDKDVDKTFNKIDNGHWYSSKWYFDFSTSLSARFKLIDGSPIMIIESGTLTASDNKYIDSDSILMVLSSHEEFYTLIKATSKEVVDIYLNKSTTNEELFK